MLASSSRLGTSAAMQLRACTAKVLPLFVTVCVLLGATCIEPNAAHDCPPIVQCDPEMSALDNYSLNQTIELRCVFRGRIDNPLDVSWKYQFEKSERMAYDADGYSTRPFKHRIVHVNGTFPNSPYSISVLQVQLLNSSYYTNYTIMSIPGGCYQTVRVTLKEHALGYTNAAVRTSWLWTFSILTFFALCRFFA